MKIPRKAGYLLLALALVFSACKNSPEPSAPAAPGEVLALAGNTEIRLSWRPVSGAVSYNIYWKTSSGVTTADGVLVNASSPYYHSRLTNGTAYYYAVTAVNDAGESGLSAEASATPDASYAETPSSPLNVSAEPGDGSISISWDPVIGAVAYNIYWKPSAGVTKDDNVIVSASSPYAHIGLTNGLPYYYAVTALNGEGESALSIEASATPYSPFSAPARILVPADPQANAMFGHSISTSGEYAIIGANGKCGGADGSLPYAGAAYIYHKTGYDTWDSGTKILAPDMQASDSFGTSVSISGDYAIVGAWGEDGGAGDPISGAGAAYIYHRTGPNAWDGGKKLMAIDAQAGDGFGYSVAICGDYAIVGASGEDGGPGDPYPDSGAAYVFHRIGENEWDSGTMLRAVDAQAGDSFGSSASISGDYCIIGAQYEDGGTGDPLIGAGAAYIFHRISGNSWDSGTRISSSNAQADGCFGTSVSICDDTALIGARKERGSSSDPSNIHGSAYVLHRTGMNTWAIEKQLLAPDAQSVDAFGYSVSIRNGIAIVGAYIKNGGSGNSIAYAGAAYIFHGFGLGLWDDGRKLIAPDAQAYDYFGSDVSICDGYALVGAIGEDGGAGDPFTEAGAVYFFR